MDIENQIEVKFLKFCLDKLKEKEQKAEDKEITEYANFYVIEFKTKELIKALNLETPDQVEELIHWCHSIQINMMPRIGDEHNKSWGMSCICSSHVEVNEWDFDEEDEDCEYEEDIDMIQVQITTSFYKFIKFLSEREDN